VAQCDAPKLNTAFARASGTVSGHSGQFRIYFFEPRSFIEMSDSRTERGKTVVREMMGEDVLKGMEDHIASGGFGAQVVSLAFGNGFADAWDRPGLDRKCRSMITMAAMIALRTPAEYKHHVRAALTNGCSVAEIEEVIIQTLPYVGFAPVSVALAAAAEVLQEKGLLGKTQQ
jgi:4-carboxymuconolactone decarboxylase